MCLATGLVASALPLALSLKTMPDDAYFYLKIADNLARGLGSTFDGINPTNGYHPLWLLILAGAFRSAHLLGFAEPEQLVHLTLFLTGVIHGVTALCVAATFRAVYPAVALWIIAAAYLSLTLVFLVEGHTGTESPLTGLLMAVYLWTHVHTPPRRRAHIAAGILSLLVLTRIDFAFTVVPVMLAFEIWITPAAERAGATLRLGAPPGAAWAGYIVVNYTFFGQMLTTSAVVKSSFPQLIVLDNFAVFLQDGRLAALRYSLPLVVYGWFCVFLSRRGRTTRDGVDALLLAMGTAGLLFNCAHVAFDRTYLSAWSTGWPLTVALWMLVRIALEQRWPRWVSREAIVVLLLAWAVRLHFSPVPFPYEYAPVLKAVTGELETTFQIDASGALGFFSGRRVVNGDGLVNSFEFVEYARANRVEEYLRDKRIDYYASSEMHPVPSSHPWSPPGFQDGLGFGFICPTDHVVARVLSGHGTRDHEREWILCRLRS